jgi:hypothetical protein
VIAAAQPVAVPPALFLLAERGWRLLPVQARGKTPLLREWQRLATTNPAQIRAWGQQYPGANWGVACGPGSGLWVLDVDGDSGAAALRELCREHGDDWLQTLTVMTAAGCHLYFRYPQGTVIRNSAGKLAPGLDVRGEGGYVLVPPSVHPSGKVYEWLDPNLPIADAPSWLLRMVAAPPSSAVEAPGFSSGGAAGAKAHGSQNTCFTGLKPGASTVSEKPKPGASTADSAPIAEGQRNAALTSLAGTMRRRGMTPAAIEAALLADNQHRCRPPLPEAEVRAIAHSVSRYACSEPLPVARPPFPVSATPTPHASGPNGANRATPSAYTDCPNGANSANGAAEPAHVNWPDPLREEAFYGLAGTVTAEHLLAALAVWQYCEDSASFIFGDALGDTTADEILRELRSRVDGMTRNEIREHFQRHKSSAEIARALGVLQEYGLIRMVRSREQEDSVRPTERWYALTTVRDLRGLRGLEMPNSANGAIAQETMAPCP